MLEPEFKQSIQEIDRNFELKKQEMLKTNKTEIEREQQKWETKR